MSAAEALERIRELHRSGFANNTDFVWQYFHHTKSCEFKFADAKMATLYALKWQK